METTNDIAGRTVVPAGAGRAVALRAGQHVRVVDIEGGQVGDVFAFAADDPAEYLSASHTRTHTTFRTLKPGDKVNFEVDMLARYVARLAESI